MKPERIRWIATDIDGVLTDGHIVIDEQGKEQKRIYMRDLDAIGAGRRVGLEFAFITGEDNLLARTIASRFNVAHLLTGAKDKLAALQTFCTGENLGQEEVCYIGDSDRDAAAIAWAGLGIAPADGSNDAKKAADMVTISAGGCGVLAESVEMIRAAKKAVTP